MLYAIQRPDFEDSSCFDIISSQYNDKLLLFTNKSNDKSSYSKNHFDRSTGKTIITHNISST